MVMMMAVVVRMMMLQLAFHPSMNESTAGCVRIFFRQHFIVRAHIPCLTKHLQESVVL